MCGRAGTWKAGCARIRRCGRRGIGRRRRITCRYAWRWRSREAQPKSLVSASNRRGLLPGSGCWGAGAAPGGRGPAPGGGAGREVLHLRRPGFAGSGAEAARLAWVALLRTLGRAVLAELGVGQGGETCVVAQARDEVGEGLLVEVVVEVFVGVEIGCLGALARARRGGRRSRRGRCGAGARWGSTRRSVRPGVSA